MKEKWKLNPKDVCWGWSGSSSGGSSFARKTKRTSRNVWVKHMPTNVVVQGEILQGNYSKKEMKQLTENLREKLLVELEQKVAKHLRIPGR